MGIEIYLDKKRKIINKALLKYLPKPGSRPKELAEAMRYSILAGGKRLRPVLMLAVSEMSGRVSNKILKAACAVEYIHTSTLILDDLPCMDDSDLRRGRRSLHRKFGQAPAILASYCLMASAFGLLAEDPGALRCMSGAIGFGGLCAGQFMDLKTGAKKVGPAELNYIHEHKTADLFSASCRIAGFLSGASGIQSKSLADFGKYLGLAFQVYDDILSIQKSDKELGKRTKKDKNCPNFVNLFGLDKAESRLKKYSKNAEKSLGIFKNKAGRLRQIIRYTLSYLNDK